MAKKAIYGKTIRTWTTERLLLTFGQILPVLFGYITTANLIAHLKLRDEKNEKANFLLNYFASSSFTDSFNQFMIAFIAATTAGDPNPCDTWKNSKLISVQQNLPHFT